ncbi:MAG: sulfotransferase [Anaerolineales bacterium]|nr:sulfotransferase [Anaerolineales bacterium]
MPFNLRLYLIDFFYSLFRSKGTPARLSPKRVLLLIFLFIVFPFWNLYIRVGYLWDKVFYPAYKTIDSPAPIFIIGNYRSGSTFLHRLLLKDKQFTCLKAWEIYFAPALVHRKLLRFILRVSKLIGSPVQKAVSAFDQMMNNIYPMHETGLYTYEQDSQLFYHTWSSYNIFAIFPFPELARRYIYYDQQVPHKERKKQFVFYRDALKRHLVNHPGKQYISKNPDFTPALETILEVFPNAKFINLIRPAEQMIPSAINLWSKNWRAYGTPEEAFPQVDVIKEHAKHWYKYPQQKLADLPPDTYQVVFFENLVGNPKAEVSRIYKNFGLDLSKHFLDILAAETIKARNFTGNGHYLLDQMGIDVESIKKEFAPLLEVYDLDQVLPKIVAEKN